MLLKIRKRLCETHLNDNYGEGSEKHNRGDLHLPVYLGNITWLRLLDSLRKIGYERPLVFEISYTDKLGQP